MAMRDPRRIAERWARGLSAAGDKIREGVELVTVAPSEKAVAAKEKFRARLLEAIDGGVWEAALRAYTLDMWKRDMREKGIPRIPGGATAAIPKFTEFMSQLLPHIQSGLAELERKPAITLEDSIERVTFWIRHMAKFKKKPAPA